MTLPGVVESIVVVPLVDDVVAFEGDEVGGNKTTGFVVVVDVVVGVVVVVVDVGVVVVVVVVDVVVVGVFVVVAASTKIEELIHERFINSTF